LSIKKIQQKNLEDTLQYYEYVMRALYFDEMGGTRRKIFTCLASLMKVVIV